MTMTEWLTVPDLVDLLGSTPSRIRRLIEDRHLPGTRRDGVLVVPAEFLRDGAVIPEIQGTAILLADAGFSADEIVNWLLEPEPSIGDTPIAALRAGRKSFVRRVAQSLA
ncbi:MAG TPA: Rv2175c family DNA-binding protein [Microbacteriaceae bacterium]|nr:Rv2175c family DNA-binding protein [Microbacteriaceae bacterium]